MPPPMVCSVRRVWLVWFRLGRVERGVASLKLGAKTCALFQVSPSVRDFASCTGIASHVVALSGGDAMSQ